MIIEITYVPPAPLWDVRLRNADDPEPLAVTQCASHEQAVAQARIWAKPFGAFCRIVDHTAPEVREPSAVASRRKSTGGANWLCRNVHELVHAVLCVTEYRANIDVVNIHSLTRVYISENSNGVFNFTLRIAKPAPSLANAANQLGSFDNDLSIDNQGVTKDQASHEINKALYEMGLIAKGESPITLV